MRQLKIVLVTILFLLTVNLIATKYLGINIISANQYNASYYIVVDLDSNTLYLYKDNKLSKSYPVSSGTYYTPSPIGTWTIVSEANWGEGFGGSWMGFNVPWGKYGIHGTDEPWSIGNEMSKGCIRMYNDDAKELKKIVHVGTKVTIIKGPYGPFGTGFRTLEPGDIGSDVYALQERLKELGYYQGWVDGKYGNGMQVAVIKFQKDNNLPISKYLTEEFYIALGINLFE